MTYIYIYICMLPVLFYYYRPKFVTHISTVFLLQRWSLLADAVSQDGSRFRGSSLEVRGNNWLELTDELPPPPPHTHTHTPHSLSQSLSLSLSLSLTHTHPHTRQCHTHTHTHTHTHATTDWDSVWPVNSNSVDNFTELNIGSVKPKPNEKHKRLSRPLKQSSSSDVKGKKRKKLHNTKL